MGWEGDEFYDVGANIGLYSLYAATIQPKATVYAFEAEAMNFSRLMKNTAINNLARRLTPFNLAVADETRLGYLNLSQLSVGAALHSFGEVSSPRREGIFGKSLDELVSTYSLPIPNLLKVDVDSIEHLIFKGATKILKYPALTTILTEINIEEPDSKYIDQLITAESFVQTAAIPTDPQKKILNCIYSKSDKSDSVI
jgi:FkbM family methyltransferase